MSLFVFLCVINILLQLGFVLLFFIYRKWIDLINFGVCLTTLIIPTVLESLGMEEYFSKYFFMGFLLLIVVLSGWQFKHYYKLREKIILVRVMGLIIIASLYVTLYFYADLLNTA